MSKHRTGVSLDEAIVIAGGFGKHMGNLTHVLGRFQAFTVFFYLIAFICGGFLVYSCDYLTEKPIYRCEKTPGQFDICTSDEICAGHLNYYVDWTSHESLDNWIATLDLMCESTFTINYITHAYYFGGIIGSLMIARIPDLYGRKVPFAASLAAQLPCYIGLICSRSLALSVVLSFLVGVVNAGIYNGGFINVCEYVHSPWKNHVCTLLLIMDNFTVCLVCLYFKYVTRYWLWFQLFGVTLNAVALVGILMISESPEYLYSFYRFDDCRAVLQRIAQ